MSKFFKSLTIITLLGIICITCLTLNTYAEENLDYEDYSGKIVTLEQFGFNIYIYDTEESGDKKEILKQHGEIEDRDLIFLFENKKISIWNFFYYPWMSSVKYEIICGEGIKPEYSKEFVEYSKEKSREEWKNIVINEQLDFIYNDIISYINTGDETEVEVANDTIENSFSFFSITSINKYWLQIKNMFGKFLWPLKDIYNTLSEKFEIYHILYVFLAYEAIKIINKICRQIILLIKNIISIPVRIIKFFKSLINAIIGFFKCIIRGFKKVIEFFKKVINLFRLIVSFIFRIFEFLYRISIKMIHRFKKKAV